MENGLKYNMGAQEMSRVFSEKDTKEENLIKNLFPKNQIPVSTRPEISLTCLRLYFPYLFDLDKIFLISAFLQLTVERVFLFFCLRAECYVDTRLHLNVETTSFYRQNVWSK